MRRPGVLLAVQLVLAAAILASLVALATRHPRRVDLTPDRRFTLSAHTRDVLRRIGGDVRIVAFTSSQSATSRQDAATLLGLYRDAAPGLEVRVLDLDRSPGFAQRLGVDAYDTAVVEAGERRARVDVLDEESVTAALLAVAGTPPVATYFLVGHGEHDPRDTDSRAGASEAARALATEGFRVGVLEGAAAIPADAGLVVVAGPSRDLTGAEVDALGTWVARGGRALVLADPGAPPSVGELLRRFGVELGGDLVVDDRARLVGADGRSARVAYVNQSVVRDTPAVQALLPVAQSLRLIDAPGVRADYLATTSETTWADVDRRPEGDFRPGIDRRGPLPVAALARVGEAGRVVAVGDADFASNLHFGVLGNKDLLVTVAEVAARGEASGAARTPARPAGTFSPLALTAREARLVFWSVVVAPGVACAAMAALLARRRRWA